jgi:hypothetical protein
LSATRALAAAAADACARRFFVGSFLVGRLLLGRRGGFFLAFGRLPRGGTKHLFAVGEQTSTNGVVLDVREAPKLLVQHRGGGV